MKKKPLLHYAGSLFAGTVLFAATALMSTTIGNAQSDKSHKKVDKTKQEQVYQHRQSKNILPFKDILKTVRTLISGEIIETEFEVEHGIPTYEFKYIDKAGRVREIYVNARTGNIIKEEID
jgi:uncharacterized membrane protein YkoI